MINNSGLENQSQNTHVKWHILDKHISSQYKTASHDLLGAPNDPTMNTNTRKFLGLLKCLLCE